MNFLDVRYRFDDPAQHGLSCSLRQAPPASERTRSHLLASAIKITPGLFPALAEGLRNLGNAMMLQDEVDCFVLADPAIQAYCMPHQSGERERFTVVISSALVERLKIDEIRFVIGHEIGHFLCGHWRYPNEDEDGSVPVLRECPKDEVGLS
jgi:Zn-dependent protease with chaperone function